MPERPKLGELLVMAGAINQTQLGAALSISGSTAAPSASRSCGWAISMKRPWSAPWPGN
jgi:hypothetical protein